MSDPAASRVTPGFNRPMTWRKRGARMFGVRGSAISAQMLVVPSNCALCGTTPTTMNGIPSSRISRPITAGSPPKRERQNASLKTTALDSRCFVGGNKRPTRYRRDAKNVKDAGRDPLTGNRLGRAVGASHHHAADARNEPGHLFKRAILVVPIEEVERRNTASEQCVRSLPDHHQALWIAEWQRTQQRGVDQREDGAVGADAERQRASPRRM